MMVADDKLAERRAYARGYSRGARWPEHRPPAPPEPIVAHLMAAATRLADAVDGELATLLEDDPWQQKLGNPMDDLRAAMVQVTRWLKQQTE